MKGRLIYLSSPPATVVINLIWPSSGGHEEGRVPALRFQRSDTGRGQLVTRRPPQMGQKLLVGGADSLCGVFKVHLQFRVFCPKWRRSCEPPRTKSGRGARGVGRGVSKELFSARRMGTGDGERSHPVTICTGVTLVTQIGRRCWGITPSSTHVF